MKYLIILSLLLQSCGKDSDTTDNKAPSPSAAPTSKQPVTAMAVATPADRPDCLAGNNYQLVYVKSEKAFYNCISAVWEAIVIATPVTYTAAKGDKGDKGDQAPALPSNVWIDPSSGLQWFIGSATTNYFFWNESCKNGWRKASITELVEANHRGLVFQLQKLSASTIVWRQSLPEVTTATYYNMLDEYVYSTSQTATILCVK